MKTLAVASQKGGSGKSTITIHLAVAAQQAGMDVIIADLDPHSQTAAEWAFERPFDKPSVVSSDAEDIEALQKQASDEGFDLLILDCPPYVDDVVMMATRISDFTLIPAQPRFADIKTLPRVIESVAEPYAVVLNACTPGPHGMETAKTLEVRRVLEAGGIPVAPLHITRREAFADALMGGEAVNEFDPEGKASHEVKTLWKWLRENW